MTITRPPSLSPEEMDKLFERLANRGAKIELRDPAVTSTQNWIMVAVGGSLITVGAWGINSINKLNETMATVIAQASYGDRTDQAQNNRLDDHESRMRQLESIHAQERRR